MDLSLLTPGPNMPECSFHSRLVLQLPQPSLLETRSQVDWQAWLMPMDCFSCHQGMKGRVRQHQGWSVMPFL